jgi:hypothetical protein
MKLNSCIALFVLFVASFAAQSAMSQNYVEIGSGNVANTMPIYSSWNYTWSALIYNHTELGTAKTITKIGLNCTNGPKTVTNQKMYVKLSSAAVFAAANYEDPANNGYVLVFQGDITFQNGWNEIVLTTPIAYDGVQNLLIHWENRWGNTYGPQFTSTASSINNNKNCGNDVNFPLPNQIGYLNPYPGSLTNMRFYYASTGPATPVSPLPADNATVVSVDTDLSWTLGANTSSYDLYLGTDPLNLTLKVSNAPCSAGVYSYPIAGLLADSTMHYWKVVAKSGSLLESSPVWKFKTEVVIDQFPYNEGFEDSTVFHTYPVVSAWVTAPENSWYEYNAYPHSGLLCAKSYASLTGNSAILRSPKVLLPAGHSISWYWRNTNVNKVAAHDTTYFEVSANCGTTWTALDMLAPATANVAYVQRTMDLNAYAGNNFFFRFRHMTDNTSGSCNLYLDDISIFQTGATPTLLVTPTNQNVSSPEGTTDFSVTSNSAWAATSDQTWCTVTPSGSGNGSITANFTENTTGVQRVAHVSVTVTGLSPVIVTVTQGTAISTLSVSPSNQNVSAPAGNSDFAITSNSSWTASSNQSWCTITSSGTGNGTLNAIYTENTDLTPRIATLTVTVTGLSPVVVTLTQDGAAPFLLATPANQEVPFTAGTTNFTVSSNVAWSAISDAGWCAVNTSGTGNSTLFATYAENMFAAARTAHITISATGTSPVTVTVFQQCPLPVLIVTPPVQNVTWQAGIITFAISSNTAWTTSTYAPWCQPTAGGSGSGVITVTYLPNETMITRTALMSVTAVGIAPVELQIIQSPSFVSVGEVNASGLRTFPNPAWDYVTVLLPDYKPGAFAQIYNSKGEKVLEQGITAPEFKMDVSGLSKGNYLMKVFNGDVVINRTIVVI